MLDVAADAVGAVVGGLALGLMLHGVGQGRLYGYLIGLFLVASSIYLLVSMVRRRRWREASSSGREERQE